MTLRFPPALAVTFVLLLPLAAVAALPSPALAATSGGFQVVGTELRDANGYPFVARGTNLPHAWHPQRFHQFVDAAGLGASTARVALNAGLRHSPPNSAADVARVVAECERTRLVCVLSVQDATGFGEDPAAVSIADVVDRYWAQRELRAALSGTEAHVLINVANAPRGDVQPHRWTAEAIDAVQSMRRLGYEHTLVLDGPNWGQDTAHVMVDNARLVAAIDPLQNTVFSVHMYGSYPTDPLVTNYFSWFQAIDLPLLVSEFGYTDRGQPVAYETILEQAQSRGVGWTAAVWSSSGSGVARYSLDQVRNFEREQLTNWGETVFEGSDGIQETGRRATVFPGCVPPRQEGPPGPPGAPRAGEVGPTSVALDWGPACGEPVEYLVVHVVGGFEVLIGQTAGSPPPNVTTITGLSPGITYEIGVRARNANGQVGPRSETVTVVTPPAPDPELGCAMTYWAQPWGGSSGYTAAVTVTNLGSSSIADWTLTYEYPPGRQVTPPGWNVVIAQDGTTVTATPVGWNNTIPPNATVSFGYNGTGNSNSPGPVFPVSDATLNGAPCTVGPGEPPPWA